MPEIAIIISTEDLVCPRCGAVESNGDGTVNIRGYKIMDDPRDGWWSECLVCSCWFSQSGKIHRSGGQHKRGGYADA